MYILYMYREQQGWGAGVGAGCFWLHGAGASWKKNRSRRRNRLEKKVRSRSHYKLSSSALLEDKKHKEIVLFLLFFNSEFLWLNKQLFYFYIFCSFTLIVCGEKNILPNLTKSQEPEPVSFGPLEPVSLKKNTRSLSRSRLEKNQEPEPLEKNSGAAAKQLAGSTDWTINNL